VDPNPSVCISSVVNYPDMSFDLSKVARQMKVPALMISITLIFAFVFMNHEQPNAKHLHRTARAKIVSDSMTSGPIPKEILTYHGIDSVLNLLPQVSFRELEKDYLVFSGYDKWIWRGKMNNMIFYRITGNDSLKLLAGKFRFADFLPKDTCYYRNIKPPDERYMQYLCLDTSILHRFLDLIVILRDSGYTDAFTINDGFRYPSFNNRAGGASLSMHIRGLAIDIAVGDINNDGVADEVNDKKIIIRMLENSIIGNRGGIGRYPGCNVVHFDTRGFRARWDEQ